jgi:hypothetical protein
MKIILEGDHYARFRADLLAHRDKFPLNDADYVDQVLKISLNTFKKCVNAAGHLALTRPTFLHSRALAEVSARKAAVPLLISIESAHSEPIGVQRPDGDPRIETKPRNANISLAAI